jgi:hypothetical protein
VTVREHDYEPVRGLPGRLPPGEEILWQGAPDWRALTRRAFHADKVALYFAILLAWQAATVVYQGRPTADIAAAALWLVPMGAVAAGLLTLFAWLNARMTVYTITNRRVVVKFGVALPMTVNLPFALVHDVQMKAYRDGSGDLALVLGGDERVSYVHLWPHVRRWHFAKPQPMLRVVPGVRGVAEILGEALASFAHARPETLPATDAVRPASPDAQQLAAAG